MCIYKYSKAENKRAGQTLLISSQLLYKNLIEYIFNVLSGERQEIQSMYWSAAHFVCSYSKYVLKIRVINEGACLRCRFIDVL